MSNTDDIKIMGIVPKSRYVYFAYMFILISGAGNALFSLFSMIGLSLASAVPAVIVLGLLAAILAVIGLTTQKNEFSAHDHAHFKYIVILFVAFFVLNILLSGGLSAIAYFLGYLAAIALGLAEAVLAWTGFNSWQDGRIITKDNIKDEVKLAIAKR